MGPRRGDGGARAPGDELVPAPRWQWTHAVEIHASAEEVWPWMAQVSSLISRYRCAFSDHRAMRLAFGPALLEPIGYAMDRRMLLGIKELAERAGGS